MTAQVSLSTVSPNSLEVPNEEPAALEPEHEADGGHGYITNGELLAWLSNVTSGRYDEMRSLMFDCDRRRELQKDLGQLRALMDETKVGGDQEALLEAAQQLLDKYGGTGFAPELEKLLGPMVSVLQARTDAPRDRTIEVTELPIVGNGAGSSSIAGVTVPTDLTLPAVPAPELDAWGAGIQSEIDSLAKQDQLMLINIQEIQGQINQQTQLASNLVAASARALDNTVANIRG